ncbi:hypothetical protein MTR_5g430460 [Medicago truncatula]|uniref:RNase H type-1 domain-containing protein n=1 Tax=Medicago truncatula TaxID=3880 RepID=A0A072UF14_MEDTR|nr:hypothetical protein MTR_5g430460 [Medicago truncatula]
MLLTTPFTKEEFRATLFSLHPHKCLDPDGYNPVMRYSKFQQCCAWLDTGQSLASINMTNIDLIPKGNSRTTMEDFRYFPTKNYPTATFGHNPSCVWRSILRANFLVRGGSQWSMGSGTYIPILDEPWLLNGGCIDDNITEAHLVHEFRVDSLWILIPKVGMALNDRLVWKAEKNGKYIYSVQSAYRLCVEDLVDMQRQRPTLGHLKCNIDASFLQSMNRVGIAICVRDNDEAFVLVKTMSFSPLRSVLLVIL